MSVLLQHVSIWVLLIGIFLAFQGGRGWNDYRERRRQDRIWREHEAKQPRVVRMEKPKRSLKSIFK